MVTLGENTAWPSLSFRNEAPRAMAGPAMAPIRGPISEVARRFSKITGAVVEAILRAPSRATARRPASAPMDSGVGRSACQRRLRPSPPRSMPPASEATTEADREKPEAACGPLKPALVTSRHWDVDQLAEPPSLLLTPGTARAAASAASARASRAVAEGSAGSNRSRSGHGPRARRSAGARPA